MLSVESNAFYIPTIVVLVHLINSLLDVFTLVEKLNFLLFFGVDLGLFSADFFKNLLFSTNSYKNQQKTIPSQHQKRTKNLVFLLARKPYSK